MKTNNTKLQKIAFYIILILICHIFYSCGSDEDESASDQDSLATKDSLARNDSSQVGSDTTKADSTKKETSALDKGIILGPDGKPVKREMIIIGEEDFGDKEENKEIAFAYFELGNAFYKDIQIDDALKSYRMALSYYQDFAEAYGKLGICYHTKLLFAEAIDALKKSIALDSSLNESFFLLGDIHKDIRKPKVAIDYLTKLTFLEKDSVRANNTIGDIYYSQSDFKSAIENYKISLKKKEKQAHIYSKIGDILMILEDFPEAKKMFEKALGYDKSIASASNNLGVIYMNQDDLTNAKKFFEDAVKSDAGFEKAYNNLGTVYAKKKQYDKAIENYNYTLELNNSLAETHMNVGMMYYYKGDFLDAYKSFEKAMLGLFDNPQLHYYMGLTNMELGASFKAIKYLSKSQKLAPKWFKPKEHLLELYKETEDHYNALKTARQILKIVPKQFSALKYVALEDFRNGKFKLAKARFDILLGLQPDDYKILTKYGFILKNENEYLKAIPYFEKSIAIYPIQTDLCIALCNINNILNHFDQTIKYGRIGLDYKPDNVLLIYEYGFALYKTGKIDEAINILTKGQSFEPNNANILAILANAYALKKDYDIAISLANESLKYQIQNYWALNALGLSFYKTGRIEESIRKLKEASIIAPSNSEIRLNLGQAYIDYKKPYFAISVLNKLIQDDFRIYKAYDLLASAYIDIDEIENAIQIYRSVLEVNHKYAKAYFNLGVIEFNKGYILEAYKFWTKCLKNEPDEYIKELSLKNIELANKTRICPKCFRKMEDKWEICPFDATKLQSGKRSNFEFIRINN